VTGGADTLRDLLIATCAVSAGIHAAAGTAFAASAALLAGLAVALTRGPDSPVLVATAATLAALLAAYVLAVTTGVPVLHPEPEPVDGLALFTKAVEATGLAAALNLLRPKGAFA
jgi:hypothetical protein